MNKQTKKAAAVLAALAATGVLAACGSGSSDDNGSVSGRFEPVADAPIGYANVAGEATLERPDGGTETAISLTGLKPDTAYVAHLHTGGCDGTDPGGSHFKFDPTGGEEPPNEIHFAFTANAEGEGEATARSDREVPEGEAGSIVVHLDPEAMTAAPSSIEAETVFVHEGVDHSKEGPGHGGAHEHPEKIACAQLEAETSEPAAIGPENTIVIENGEPTGGVREMEFQAGEEIAFRVESDIAEEIHVHGYDLSQNVAAGGDVEFRFPADIEGIFEVELEELGEQIAELRVEP
ncbi:MAG TPA: hypothetical protein VK889_02805 [Solirubrobacterales bacterium]|nr:hypothetical protein [Solirubrobacterales bacterium]